MSYSVKIIWKVFGHLSGEVRPYEQNTLFHQSGVLLEPDRLLFNVETGKTFLREIGGNAKDTFAPLVLSPTRIFYNALRPKVVKELLCLTGKKFPLHIPIPSGTSGADSVRVNFSIRVYERVVCISVETDEFMLSDPSLLETLTKIESHSGLVAVTKKILAMTETHSKHSEGRGGSLKAFHCVQLIADAENDILSDQFLTRLVTKHPGANDAVTLAQIEKNNAHKIDSTTLLCDRQGVVAFVPHSSNVGERAGMLRRFRSAAAMLELAAAIQRVLALKDPLTKKRLGDIILLINNPDFVFSNSTSGRIVWGLFLDEFKLKPSLEAKKNMLSSNIAPTKHSKILCMAAALVEFKTISAFLKAKFGPSKPKQLGEGKNFDAILEYIDAKTDRTWYLAPQLAQGVTSAAVDVARIADLIQPDVIVMVGMCMGMPDRKIPPGTVIVPNAITLLDHQRLKAGQTQYRPRSVSVASGLHNVARLALLELESSYEVIIDKALACASVKIEDINIGLVPFIKSYLPDVAAFDMEGWGFYEGTVKYHCLWIKAVSDSGEEQGVTEDERSTKQQEQAKATQNAIDFAIRVVEKYEEIGQVNSGD